MRSFGARRIEKVAVFAQLRIALLFVCMGFVSCVGLSSCFVCQCECVSVRGLLVQALFVSGWFKNSRNRDKPSPNRACWLSPRCLLPSWSVPLLRGVLQLASPLGYSRRCLAANCGARWTAVTLKLVVVGGRRAKQTLLYCWFPKGLCPIPANRPWSCEPYFRRVAHYLATGIGVFGGGLPLCHALLATCGVVLSA